MCVQLQAVLFPAGQPFFPPLSIVSILATRSKSVAALRYGVNTVKDCREIKSEAVDVGLTRRQCWLNQKLAAWPGILEVRRLRKFVGSARNLWGLL
jgi:hypothetical protein